MANFRQVQGLKQKLSINPQQIKFLSLLQLNALELEAYIQSEIEENPLLEEEPAAIYPQETYPNTPESITENWIQQTVANEISFQEVLKTQLAYLKLNKRCFQICEYLIDSLNEKGFLKIKIADFLDDLSFAHNLYFSKNEVEEALKVIQQLDPSGLGSENLQTFLLNQVKPASPLFDILKNHFELLSKKSYEAILKKSALTSQQLAAALKELAQLRPYPAFGYARNENIENNTIHPEYKVEHKNGTLHCSLISYRTKSLKVNEAYLSRLKNEGDKKAQTFLKGKLKEGLWLTQALKEREETMALVIHEISLRQEDFFKSGEWTDLKPMILRDISQSVNRSIATISRVSSNKYVQYDYGVILLKSLFSESTITSDGKLISNKEIQEMVKSFIENENQNLPLADKDIMNKLQQEGIVLTRRTITKYRENLNIPSSQNRRTYQA